MLAVWSVLRIYFIMFPFFLFMLIRNSEKVICDSIQVRLQVQTGFFPHPWWFPYTREPFHGCYGHVISFKASRLHFLKDVIQMKVRCGSSEHSLKLPLKKSKTMNSLNKLAWNLVLRSAWHCLEGRDGTRRPRGTSWGVWLHGRHCMQNWQEDVEDKKKRRQARMNKTNLGVWLEVLLKNSVSSFTLENNIISLQEARPEMGRSRTRAIKNELKDEADRKKKRGLK